MLEEADSEDEAVKKAEEILNRAALKSTRSEVEVVDERWDVVGTSKV